jgi:hypothetical protein
MSPEEFNKLKSNDKWTLRKNIHKLNVQWVCGYCGIDQDYPERMWDGSRHCSECDHTLTRRTGGGQNDPFGYSFKYKIVEIRNDKLNKLGIC